jgi:hypothetical protein
MGRKNTHLRVGLPRFVIAVPVFQSQFLRTPRRPVRSAPTPDAARSRIAARKKGRRSTKPDHDTGNRGNQITISPPRQTPLFDKPGYAPCKQRAGQRHCKGDMMHIGARKAPHEAASANAAQDQSRRSRRQVCQSRAQTTSISKAAGGNKYVKRVWSPKANGTDFFSSLLRSVASSHKHDGSINARDIHNSSK